MSRTFRRTNVSTLEKWFVNHRLEMNRPYGVRWVEIQHNSNEYKKKLAIFQSDSYRDGCREPGPKWFRTLVAERPQRRFNKNELIKFMLNPEYETMCVDMCYLPYWG